MGTVIEAVATAVAAERPFAPTSLELTDRAARECLRRAQREPAELDLLLNTGIYHDRNLGEPALAALVQEDIGANPGHPPVGGHGTFSFDVLNGVAGVITAAFIADGFMQSGAAHSGIVVAGDADPQPGKSEGFGYRRSGGAMLLGWREGLAGFTQFSLETFPEFEGLFHSAVGWSEPDGHGLHLGHAHHNFLAVERLDGFLERCVECATIAVERFEAKTGVDVSATDLLIASHDDAAFGDLLADRVGISRHNVVHLPEHLHSLHTALPMAAVEEAVRDGSLAAARHILFVCAGAGITVGIAAYENQSEVAA